MKRFFTLALAAASIGLLAAGTASAAYTPDVATYSAGDAANGIGDSRHNLGGFTEHIRANATTEICVFCHTPHHTNTANGLRPLWNRGTQAPSSLTAYGTTIGGSTIASTDIGSTTLACLSCHDGVTTFDNIVNAPGKSGVTAGGADRGWTFKESDNSVVSDFMTSSRLKIGTDLSNDHPVSVAYNANRASLRPTNITISGINLTWDLASSAVTYDNGNMTKNLWAVKGYVSDTATIADLLRGAGNTNGSNVECSSCHDPHFNNKSFNEIDSTYGAPEPESNGLFLRRVGGNTGSGLCRTCHNK